MAKVEVLSARNLVSVFSPSGLYIIAYAWLFGMCEYNHALALMPLVTPLSVLDHIFRW